MYSFFVVLPLLCYRACAFRGCVNGERASVLRVTVCMCVSMYVYVYVCESCVYSELACVWHDHTVCASLSFSNSRPE